VDKKEKPSILTFHGKELLEASGLTYMDIEKRCGREALQYRTVYSFTVVMDPDGTPAPCINVVIADDGQSLTCTTSAHVAGWVDVTISDGVNEPVTLANGYEYVENYKGEGGGGLIGLIDKILSPNSGIGKVLGLVALGEIVFIVVGVAVFFKIKEQ